LDNTLKKSWKVKVKKVERVLKKMQREKVKNRNKIMFSKKKSMRE